MAFNAVMWFSFSAPLEPPGGFQTPGSPSYLQVCTNSKAREVRLSETRFGPRGAMGDFPISPFLGTWLPGSVTVIFMNREIARALLNEELGRLRKLSYAEFLKVLNRAFTTRVQGRDGKTYQVERQAFWDSKKGGNIRVMVCIDDCGLSAFKPLSGAFIISPGGSFIGEQA